MKAAQSWWVRALVIALFMAALQPFMIGNLYFTGDEGHYMLAAMSYVRDGDFNLANNYRERQYTEFTDQPFAPQWVPVDTPVIHAEHGTALPLVIAPAYALGGIRGVQVFLLVLSFVACLLTGGIVDRATGNRTAGTAAAVLLATTPTWAIQGSRAYPDIVVGLLFAVALLCLFASPSSRMAAAAVGFCSTVLPVFAIKYGLLGAPLLVAALAIPEFRRNAGLYAGAAAAVALGVWNVARWGAASAIGGNFIATQPHLFGFEGMFGRYWKQWFDSHHGLFVLQPYTILALWAAVHFGRRVEDKRLAGASAAVLAFTGMHMAWLSNPGWSYPGRYLAALLPAIAVLVVCWSLQCDAFRRVRTALIAASALFGMALLVLAWSRGYQPDFAFRPWTTLFPKYWPSWHNIGATATHTEPAEGPYLMLALIAGTKWAAAWRTRRR